MIGSYAKAKAQERAAKSGLSLEEAPHSSQGEPKRSAPVACKPPGFWLLPINVHEGLHASHTHSTGGMPQGHSHDPLQRHASLGLGLGHQNPWHVV